MFIILIQCRHTLLDVPALHCTNKGRLIGMCLYCSSSLIVCVLCVCECISAVRVCGYNVCGVL